MITKETATKLAVAHAEIDCAQRALTDLEDQSIAEQRERFRLMLDIQLPGVDSPVFTAARTLIREYMGQLKLEIDALNETARAEMGML